MLYFMYWRLRIRKWCTLFHFDSCPEKKLVNNCLDIDHSCSHLPAVNPAIFQGVTFNNFGSGLIYDSKKIEKYTMPFPDQFCALLCTMSVYCEAISLLATTLVQSVSLSPEVDEIIASMMFML